MKRFHNLFLVLPAFCLLVGCSDRNLPSADTSADDIEVTYYYHGFLIERADKQAPAAPDGIYIIDTQEECGDFITAYELGSIYPLDTVDFEKECLIYCSRQSAQPSRGWSGKIQSVRVSGEQLECVEDETVNFDGENEDEAVAYQIIGADCAVREVFFLKASKEAISEDLRNRYQPDDI